MDAFGPIEKVSGTVVRVYRKVDTKTLECEFHYKHNDIPVFKIYDLAVTYRRKVPDLFAVAWGGIDLGHCKGLKAVDQFGDIWEKYWNGSDSDGTYGSYWNREEDGVVGQTYLSLPYIIEGEN
jgi:hypothetical protein